MVSKEESVVSGLDSSYPDIFNKLEQVVKEQVFEVCAVYKSEVYVTYMMNDAIESFLVFENARIVGQYEDMEDDIITASICREKEEYVFIVRQKNSNTFTIWFKNLVMRTGTYQYHNIGHYWVEDEEYLRQLVYRIDLIKDKYMGYGEEFCNKQELALLPLSEFGPLNAYVYVSWDKAKMYPSTEKGIDTFYKIAEETSDVSMQLLVKAYKKKPSSIFRQRRITNALKKEKHQKLVKSITNKIQEGSVVYAQRSFGEKEDKLVNMCRDYVYVKCADKWQDMHIEVLEEQPFTIFQKPFTMKFFFLKLVKCGRYIEQERSEITLVYNDTEEIVYNRFKKMVDQII